MDRIEDAQTTDELWKIVDANKEEAWYNASVQFWDNQEASYNGVLGGFGHVSGSDIAESQRFLKKAFSEPLKQAAAGQRHLIAVDCGAGVGRVTEQLLLHHFQEVDLLEPSKHLLSKAEERLTGSNLRSPPGNKLGKVFPIGLQQFSPELHRYDVIWIQWALLYLTDSDAIALFQRCKEGLKEDGIMFVKENICPAGSDFVVDKDDKSVTRSNAAMQKLFRDAGMQLLYSAQQKNFPKELYAVHMYAIKPKSS